MNLHCSVKYPPPPALPRSKPLLSRWPGPFNSGLLMVLLVLGGAGGPVTARSSRPDRALSVRYNLLSNPSFEASFEGHFPSWSSQPEASWQQSSESPWHGQYCSQSSGLPVATTLTQRLPACPRATYELSLWVRTVGDRSSLEAALVALQAGGEVMAEVREVSAGQGDWQMLTARLTVPRLAAWLQVQLTAPAGSTVAVDAVRLQQLRGPTTYGPVLAHLAVHNRGANWALLTWDSEETSFILQTRQSGARPGPWVTHSDLHYPRFSWQNLTPDTPCEARVSLPQPPHYDETGQLVPCPRPVVQTPVLSWRTLPWAPRQWGPLQLWPSCHLATFPDGQSYPCLAAYRDGLLVVEAHGGAVHLSRVRPPELQIEQTRPLLSPAAADHLIYSDLATCVFADRLYVAATVHRPATPLGSPATTLRVMAYDLALDQLVDEPFVIPPTRPGVTVGAGALHTFRNQVWLAWLETETVRGQPHSRLLVAPLAEGGLEGEPQIWSAAPTNLFSPALADFEERLALVFTDLTASASLPGYEPLGLVQFDGFVFTRRQRLTGLGSSRHPAAQQWGRHLALTYTSDAAYAIYDRRYRDLRLTLLGPGGAGH
jgi:hypothetical protein